MSDSENLVSIYKAANVTEAHLVKNLLLQAGIESRVTEEYDPLAGLNLASPDVLVHCRDFVRAESVIDQYEERQIARMQGPEWKCEGCSALNYAGYDSCDTCGLARPKKK